MFLILVCPSNAAAAQTGIPQCTIAMAMIWNTAGRLISSECRSIGRTRMLRKHTGTSRVLDTVANNFHCICKVHWEQPLVLCSRTRKRDPHHNTRQQTRSWMISLSKALPCFPSKGIDYPPSKMCSVLTGYRKGFAFIPEHYHSN